MKQFATSQFSPAAGSVTLPDPEDVREGVTYGNGLVGTATIAEPYVGNDLRDLMADIADDFFDEPCIATDAAYKIVDLNGTETDFTIRWIPDDDDDNRRKLQSREDRERTLIGWVPREYTAAGIPTTMPVPSDRHFVKPAGETHWFQFDSCYERSPAGFLCLFRRTTLTVGTGFGNERFT